LRRITICLALLAITSLADAQRIHRLSYQQLLDTSDLVVIAEAESTQATDEIITPDKTDLHFQYVGVSTTLRIAVVLKGDKGLRSCVVHHYKLADPETILVHGRALVTFDTSGKSDYLLFLKREEDGRYAPTTAPVNSELSIFLIRSNNTFMNP
jgi:hypothetical protein